MSGTNGDAGRPFRLRSSASGISSACRSRPANRRGNIMLEWALLPLKRYADFSGRSRRKEYWSFALLIIAISIVLSLVFGLGSVLTDPSSAMAAGGFGLGLIVLLLFGLAIFIPSLAVQVRRFHDQDKSGWFVLINLIPYLG